MTTELRIKVSPRLKSVLSMVAQSSDSHGSAEELALFLIEEGLKREFEVDDMEELGTAVERLAREMKKIDKSKKER